MPSGKWHGRVWIPGGSYRKLQKRDLRPVEPRVWRQWMCSRRVATSWYFRGCKSIGTCCCAYRPVAKGELEDSGPKIFLCPRKFVLNIWLKQNPCPSKIYILLHQNVKPGCGLVQLKTKHDCENFGEGAMARLLTAWLRARVQVKALRAVLPLARHECSCSGCTPRVTNVVPAGTRSPARNMQVARGPVLQTRLAWSMSSDSSH